MMKSAMESMASSRKSIIKAAADGVFDAAGDKLYAFFANMDPSVRQALLGGAIGAAGGGLAGGVASGLAGQGLGGVLGSAATGALLGGVAGGGGTMAYDLATGGKIFPSEGHSFSPVSDLASSVGGAAAWNPLTTAGLALAATTPFKWSPTMAAGQSKVTDMLNAARSTRGLANMGHISDETADRLGRVRGDTLSFDDLNETARKILDPHGYAGTSAMAGDRVDSYRLGNRINSSLNNLLGRRYMTSPWGARPDLTLNIGEMIDRLTPGGIKRTSALNAYLDSIGQRAMKQRMGHGRAAGIMLAAPAAGYLADSYWQGDL